MYCPQCGTQNEPRQSFCRQCGQRLMSLQLALDGRVDEVSAIFSKAEDLLIAGAASTICLSVAGGSPH
jgi:uncharacterized OB-fold protein